MLPGDEGGWRASGIEETIRTLRQKGVHLWIEGGALRYRAKRGALSAADVDDLCRSQSEVLTVLRRRMIENRFEPRPMDRPNFGRAPLAFSQLAHWKLRESAGYRPIRQVASATRIRGRLDIGALREALGEVLRNHEPLRTRIVVEGGVPQQEVVTGAADSLQVLGLAARAPREPVLAIEERLASVILDVTDYAADPLFLPVILRISERENVLLLALDHIISDGASLNIVFSEIMALYSQLIEGRRMSIRSRGMQFPDYAVWQRGGLVGYLREQLVEMSAFQRTRFPEDPNSKLERGCGWGTVRFVLAGDLRVKLEAWARHQRTSVVMAVLTAYVALICRWCEVTESIVQVMSDGRAYPILERTIGYLAFPLYMRFSCGTHATFFDLLELVKGAYCEALQRPDFFYSYVHEPRAEFTHNTCFNWLPRRELGATFQGESGALECSNIQFENPCFETLENDCEPSVVFAEAGERVLGEVNFPRAKFSRESMERFARHLGEFIDTMVSSPTTRIVNLVVR